MNERKEARGLPQEAVVAFATNRPQFLSLLKGRIQRDPKSFTMEDALSVVSALEEFMKQREKDTTRINILLSRIKALDGHISGLSKLALKAQEACVAISKDEDIPEDDRE